MTFDRDTQRAAAYASAPLEELLAVLLRQWKRPLAAHGIAFTDAEAAAYARAMTGREGSAELETLRNALIALVGESRDVLAAWGLTFAESLDADMAAIPGWETTADFLSLAEQKTNAELRIGTGAALLVVLGERDYADDLRCLVGHAEKMGMVDLDSAVARRVLAWAT